MRASGEQQLQRQQPQHEEYSIAVQRGESIRFNPDGTKVALAPRANDAELKKTIATGANKDGWNRYRIVANGPNLEHWINGKRTVLVEDNAKQAVKKGIFALQIHGGPPMVVKARKIRLKPLPQAGNK